jgi:MYXO-CTERM domain-containing protein
MPPLMKSTLSIGLGGSLAYFMLTGVAWAGTITAQGNVTALDDVAQLPSIVGSALFDEQFSGDIPLDQYPGLTFQVGELTMMLPGVMAAGEVTDPGYTSPGVHFPHPIAGGGVQQNYIILNGGAATFSEPVTQFGMTAGGSATTYITVWDASGALLGQVTWEPEDNDAAFVGLDTMGVPIGLLTVGNDDIWGGVPYDVLGAAARSDTWIWGLAGACASEANCLDDTWSCTAHACTEGACNYSLTTDPCDDDDACTDTDACAEGLCVGVPVDCSDGNVCTFDSCHSQDGCSNEPIEDCCLSDEDCPEEQTCLVGSNTCVGGPPDDDDDDDTTTTTESDTDTGDDEIGTSDETGPALDEGDRGCGCSAREHEGGAALGLLALVLLGGASRRPRRVMGS